MNCPTIVILTLLLIPAVNSHPIEDGIEHNDEPLLDETDPIPKTVEEADAASSAAESEFVVLKTQEKVTDVDNPESHVKTVIRCTGETKIGKKYRKGKRCDNKGKNLEVSDVDDLSAARGDIVEKKKDEPDLASDNDAMIPIVKNNDNEADGADFDFQDSKAIRDKEAFYYYYYYYY